MSQLQSMFSRQDWLDKVFGKNKSTRSLNLAKASLTAFDLFCMNKYGKDSGSLIKKTQFVIDHRHVYFSSDF